MVVVVGILAFLLVLVLSGFGSDRGRLCVLLVAVVLRGLFGSLIVLGHHIQVIKNADAVHAAMQVHLYHALGLRVSHNVPSWGLRSLGGAGRLLVGCAAVPAFLFVLAERGVLGGRWIVMVVVVEMVLDATVALVDFAAGVHGTFIGWLGCPQIVAESLHVKVHPHGVPWLCREGERRAGMVRFTNLPSSNTQDQSAQALAMLLDS